MMSTTTTQRRQPDGQTTVHVIYLHENRHTQRHVDRQTVVEMYERDV